MTTSGVRDQTWTVSSVVAAAFAKAEIGVDGETLSAQELADGIEQLGLMVRSWAIKPNGVRLWLHETQSVTFVSGTAAYTLSPRVLEVFQAYRRSSDNDVPIRVVSREEYSRFPNKTTSGTPVAVWIDRRTTSTVATFWPVPGATEVAASMTGRLDVKRQIEDVTAGAETLELPPEAIPALIFNLAVWIAPTYGSKLNPKVEKMADELYMDLAGQDREGSVFMRAGPRY